jgi:hypothetical protein
MPQQDTNHNKANSPFALADKPHSATLPPTIKLKTRRRVAAREPKINTRESVPQ